MASPAASIGRRFAYYGPDVIRGAIGFEHVIEPVARAFAAFSRGLGASPVAVFAPAGPDGDVHVKSAWLPGYAIFTVKVATWFRARAESGASPGSGTVAAFDARTGDLRALLEDEHHLSDIRTAAAGALAARMLARADATVLGIVGTGVQAYLQALAAASERPIERVRIWGRGREGAERLSRALRMRRPDFDISLVDSPRAACADADLLVTATSACEPLIEAAWLSPGLHVTAVGADDARKCELAPACFARADRIIVDSRLVAAEYGDVARAIGARAIDAGAISAELGEVVTGDVPGRAGDHEVTICKLVGLGVQDLAAAVIALERLERGGYGPPWPAGALDLAREARRP